MLLQVYLRLEELRLKNSCDFLNLTAAVHMEAALVLCAFLLFAACYCLLMLESDRWSFYAILQKKFNYC